MQTGTWIVDTQGAPNTIHSGCKDFRIKYIKKEHLDHLIDRLCKYHDITLDMEGKGCVEIE